MAKVTKPQGRKWQLTLYFIIFSRSYTLAIKYLGIPLGANMNRINNWEPVVSVFQSRLSSWKSKSLSIGGRVVLLKSVLESLPIYFFSIFKVPVKVVEKLESLMRNFLWGGSEEVKKMHWVAWDKVSLPKKLGGLGIWKLSLVNKALLSKWVWRFVTEEEGLWSRVIRACHGKNRRGLVLPAKVNSSGVWKNIAKMVYSFKINGKTIFDFIKGDLGDGKNIRFWLDNWIGDAPLRSKWPSLFELESDKNCWVCDRVPAMDGSTVLLWNWSAQPSSPTALAELEDASSVLADVRFSEASDRWVWSLAANRRFSAASIKALAAKESALEGLQPFGKCSWVPEKCNIFVWRSLLDRIPTRQALARRNIRIDSVFCVLCGDSVESVDHLFSGCEMSLRVWNRLCEWANIPHIFAFSFGDLVEHYKFCPGNKEYKEVVRGLIIVACWCIWNARNAKFFSSKETSWEKIFGEVRSLGFFWLKNRSKHRNIVWVEWCKSPLYMV
ncbi:putative reverse transcriptase zinc-binding domain-containing protein [Helianthus annuus]|nr:putative reverse transcriptase zinc-binding domain-containing protein [Helianthus annuus]